MKTNNYFFVSEQKELKDTEILIDLIKRENWIDDNTIIINCSPDYSSSLCQRLNHKLSYLNNNELYLQLSLECPYPIMNQIWNPDNFEYEVFDHYLKNWVIKNIKSSYKYLFVDSGVLRGKNFNKINQAISKLDIDRRFASLYVQDDSIFTPDFYTEKFNFKKQGGLLFSWENSDNKNWNY